MDRFLKLFRTIIVSRSLFISPFLTVFLIVFISSLTFEACSLGGEDDSITALSPEQIKKLTHKDSVIVRDTIPPWREKKIQSGYYIAEYDSAVSGLAGIESEFYLGQDGSFEFFGIYENQTNYDQIGKWHQVDTNIFLTELYESFGTVSTFKSYETTLDDTLKIKGVDDTSFFRFENLGGLGNGTWVRYLKRNFLKPKSGDYEYKDTVQIDSVKKHIYTEKINLNGKVFLYSLYTDTLLEYQQQAEWNTAGSFLITSKLQERNYDSTLQDLGGWKLLVGVSTNRLRAITDSSFEAYIPSSQETGIWEVYHKSK